MPAACTLAVRLFDDLSYQQGDFSPRAASMQPNDEPIMLSEERRMVRMNTVDYDVVVVGAGNGGLSDEITPAAPGGGSTGTRCPRSTGTAS